MTDLTAVIVAKGDADFILKTIGSVADLVKETIVVDIGMSAGLVKKLEALKNVRLMPFRQDVVYVELIREKTKAFAKTGYVFFLDPDEIVPPGLKTVIEEKFTDYDYFKVPRKNIIFGKWIRHSRWWPDYQVRVFKKDKVVWPKVVHSQPTASGKGFTVPDEDGLAITHHNYKNLDEYFAKAARYAKSEAGGYYYAKKQFRFFDAVQKAVNEFVSRYFSGEGFRDGVHGFILAFLQMMYYFQVYFYFLEMKNFDAGEDLSADVFFRHGLKEVFHWQGKKSIKDGILKKLL